MAIRRNVFWLGYGLMLTSWLAAAPMLVSVGVGSRSLSRVERAALRGGAPGGCNPQKGYCGGDTPGQGCALTNKGYCNNFDCDALPNPGHEGDVCGSGADDDGPYTDGQDPDQCQSDNNFSAGCVQGNPPKVVCLDNFDNCVCDENNMCNGNNNPTYTGKCAIPSFQ